MASLWRECRMWRSRPPTSPSWHDTWSDFTRWNTHTHTVVNLMDVLFVAQREKVDQALLLASLSHMWHWLPAWFPLVSRFRTVRSSVAPESWRGTGEVVRRSEGPPPAPSFPSRSSTTAPLKTRCVCFVGTSPTQSRLAISKIQWRISTFGRKMCCFSLSFVALCAFPLLSVRRWEKCLPDSWCRWAVCPETKQPPSWSSTARHTGTGGTPQFHKPTETFLHPEWRFHADAAEPTGLKMCINVPARLRIPAFLRLMNDARVMHRKKNSSPPSATGSSKGLWCNLVKSN